MPKPVELMGIQFFEIDKYWFLVEPLLAPALAYSDGKHSLNSVYEGLKDRLMQLWIVKQGMRIIAACVTQVINYPNKKVLMICFVGGEDFEDWKHLFSELKKFAEHHQCSSIEIYGRSGWKKKIQDLGFEQIHSVYRLIVPIIKDMKKL